MGLVLAQMEKCYEDRLKKILQCIKNVIDKTVSTVYTVPIQYNE